MNMYFKRYKEYLPFIILFIALLIWHWKLSIVLGDDGWFRNAIHSMPLISFDVNNFLVDRYFTWSSRTLLEVNLVACTYFPGKVWKFLDTIVFVLIAVLISKLCINQKFCSEKKLILLNFISCIFVGLFIIAFYDILESAGWIATTTNYIWPFCFALIHFYILKEYTFNSHNNLSFNKNIILNLISIIALLEAISSEQLLGVILIGYILIFAYLIYDKIKIPKMFFANFMIILLNLAYVLLSPDNSIRFKAATKLIYPEFPQLTLINKLDFGLNVFLNWSVTQADIITILFFAILGIYVYLSFNKRKISLISFIPLIISLSFWVLNISGFIHYHDLLTVPPWGILFMDFNAMLISLVLYSIICISVLFSVWIMYNNDENKKFVILLFSLFILGIISAGVCGFTPLGHSSGRVFINTYFNDNLQFVDDY